MHGAARLYILSGNTRIFFKTEPGLGGFLDLIFIQAKSFNPKSHLKIPVQGHRSFFLNA